MEQQFEQKPTQEESEQKSKREIFVRWISGIIGLVLIGVLLVVVSVSEKLTWGWFFGLVFVVLIFLGAVNLIFHFMWRSKEQPEEARISLPKSITMMQAYELVNEMMMTPRYADYIDNVKDEGVEGLGQNIKSNVYILRFTSKYTGQEMVGLVNMHDPLEKRRILVNPTGHQLEQAKQRIAAIPTDEPLRRRIVTENPILGTKTVSEEEIREERQEEKKKEDELK